MKLLLDTHVWLWSVLEPKRLSKQARRELGSAANQLWLSPVSVWEAMLLLEAGRLRLPGWKSKRPAPLDARKWVEQALSVVPMEQAPLTHAIVMESRELRLEHRDPADRFIAATAGVNELVLVTADERLLAGKGYRTLAG